MRVLNEARARYAFELRGLGFDGPTVSFYIMPDDGFELPEIMQWIKQTYAVRYNVYDGRTGHIWGDRYQSVIVEGPPKDAEEYVFLPVVREAKRGRRMRGAADKGDGGGKRGGAADSPARGAEGRPRTQRGLSYGQDDCTRAAPSQNRHTDIPNHIVYASAQTMRQVPYGFRRDLTENSATSPPQLPPSHCFLSIQPKAKRAQH